MKKRTKIFFIIIIFLVLISIINLDYKEIASFSPDLATNVFKGLMSPDFSFIYDGSGEDLLSLLLLTIAIAFLGTAIAIVFAFFLSLLSAKNLWKNNHWLPNTFKTILNILRAFPELVYAIIFVKVVGPGPFAGVMAIGVHQIGMLGKLFTEEFESMDESLIESMDSVGANFFQTLFYTRIPAVLAMFSSLSLNHFEIALRSAATLGLVGAGGIGAPLVFSIQSRAWDKVSIILLGVIITVLVLDYITGYIRKRLKWKILLFMQPVIYMQILKE